MASASDSDAGGAPLATAVGVAAPSHDGSLSSDASQAALAAASEWAENGVVASGAAVAETAAAFGPQEGWSSEASQAALAAASFMTSGRSKRAAAPAAAPGARTVALQPSGEKANISRDLSKLEERGVGKEKFRQIDAQGWATASAPHPSP